jgi:hypothetical protein
VVTNFWKKFVYLFAKSKLVIGQFPPTFIITFLRTCLCFLNSSHSHSKWSAVSGLFLQRHVGSSIILNLRKYYLSFPCPVIIVDKFMHICSVLDILPFTVNRGVTFVKRGTWMMDSSKNKFHAPKTCKSDANICCNFNNGQTWRFHGEIQSVQKVSVHPMITAQKTCKNILNSFNHLPR